MKPQSVDQMSPIEARIEHARLSEELSKHDQYYYQEDAPVISDAQYDALRQRYEALEKIPRTCHRSITNTKGWFYAE